MRRYSRRAIPALALVSLLALAGADSAQAQVVVVEKGAMLAPIVEVVPPLPRAGYAWVPGHWAWRGAAWVWIKGHYIEGAVAPMPAPVVEVIPGRPSSAHYWVKGHHVWEGGRWVWRPGVWMR